MRILAIGPSWIGDIVMSQSLYRTLKGFYPQAIIDVIAPAWCYPLLLHMPEVNEAILIPFSHGTLEISMRRKLGYNLRKKHYDRAYILPNSFKSALVPFFANIPYRVGWRGEMRYGLLNDVRILDKAAWPLMVERYVALAYTNSMVRSAKDLLQPLLWPQLQVSNNAKYHTYNAFNILSERSIIGFCPGSEFGPAKCWPHYHFAELAKQLINAGYQIILFGSAKEYEVNNKIITTLNNKQQAWCYNLAGETQLEQAVVLITFCKAIITNDSGLMHVAAALNLPLVALYGPSSPDFTPPLSHKARIIRLITGYHKMRRGDTVEGYHQSMIDITPQYVFKELHELLLNEIKTTNAGTDR